MTNQSESQMAAQLAQILSKVVNVQGVLTNMSATESAAVSGLVGDIAAEHMLIEQILTELKQQAGELATQTAQITAQATQIATLTQQVATLTAASGTISPTDLAALANADSTVTSDVAALTAAVSGGTSPST